MNDRKIRFRVWDGEKMHHLGAPHYNDEYETTSFGNCPPRAEKPLMQDTGLRDAEGTPIFEGDVVRRRGRGAKAVGWNEDRGCWAFGAEYDLSEILGAGNPRVIGNIHANPELLN